MRLGHIFNRKRKKNRGDSGKSYALLPYNSGANRKQQQYTYVKK